MSACDHCGGRGWIVDQRTRAATRCECLEKKRLEYYMERSGIPQIYRDMIGKTWTAETASDARAIKEAERISKSGTRGSLGLMLTGDPGCGKSMLCALILDKVARRAAKVAKRSGLPASWVDIENLGSRIRETYREKESGETERTIMGAVLSSDIIVIDELGLKKDPSDFSYDLLMKLIDSGACLVANTNHDMTELESRFGARVTTRLSQRCEVVALEAGNRRRKWT